MLPVRLLGVLGVMRPNSQPLPQIVAEHATYLGYFVALLPNVWMQNYSQVPLLQNCYGIILSFPAAAHCITSI